MPACLAKPIHLTLLSLIPLLSLPDHIRAELEIVTFTAGGQATAPARVAGDAIHVDGPTRSYAFPSSAIRSVQPPSSLDSEWARLLAAVPTAPEPLQLEALHWTLRHGRPDWSAALLAATPATSDSAHPLTRCREILTRLEAPCPDPDPTPKLNLKPGGLRIARSPHFFLIHQLDEPEAAHRLDLLETALTAFYLHFTALGLDPAPPSSRLVLICLPTRSAYLDFLSAINADAYRNTRGFFHAPSRLVILQATGDPRASRLRTDDRPTDAAIPTTPAAIDAQRRLFLSEIRDRELSLGIMIHETIHLLCQVSGLAPNLAHWPVWLHEGVATQFEQVSADRWQGISPPDPARVATFLSRGQKGALAPLLDDRLRPRGYDSTYYARAWALTLHLQTRDPARFATYLKRLQEAGPTPPAAHGPLFRETFSTSLPQLESAWIAHIYSLKTPPPVSLSDRASN